MKIIDRLGEWVRLAMLGSSSYFIYVGDVRFATYAALFSCALSLLAIAERQPITVNHITIVKSEVGNDL